MRLARLLGVVPLQVIYLYEEKESDPQLETHSYWQSHLEGAVIDHFGTGQEFTNGSRQINYQHS